MRKMLILGVFLGGCGLLSDDQVQRALEIVREQEGCARVRDPKDRRFEYQICRSRIRSTVGDEDAGR